MPQFSGPRTGGLAPCSERIRGRWKRQDFAAHSPPLARPTAARADGHPAADFQAASGHAARAANDQSHGMQDMRLPPA